MSSRILCVDDVPDNLKLLVADLEDEGYEVLTAADGEEAITAVELQRPDAVLLDVNMPGLSGFDVLRILRARHSPLDLPIIMATALSEVRDVVRALELGASDYVTKPLEIEVVLARLRTQLSLVRLKRESDELARLRDEFVAIASHDLKNPLVAVAGYASLLTHLVPPGAVMSKEHHAMLARIGGEAARMQRIIEDFLDFRALEDGRMTLARVSLDLNGLLHRSAESHRGRAGEKGIRLVVAPAPDLPPVPADESRIAQVVDNLVGNAVKFCGRGATVTMGTRAEAGRGVVEVSDEGPGLTDDDLARVFGKWERLSARPTGGEKSTGLGLRICKLLVEAHGGEIGVRNREAGGATFWFALPLGG